MFPFSHKIGLFWLAVLAAATAFPGCADGPIPETKVLNPWVRKQWAEDEQRTTTYHHKVKDLADIRAKAASKPLAEREELSADFAARLKEEKSPALRAEFVRTLTEFKTPAAEQALLAAMTDESAAVRVLACKGLGKQPSADGLQALAHALTDDQDLDVRIVAAREMGHFRGFEATKSLRPALDERDPALQLAAMQSLETLDGHTEYRRNVAVWREHLDGGSPSPPPAPSIAETVRQYLQWF
jgi:hypothetical protein